MRQTTAFQAAGICISLILAFVLWYAMFALHLFNFWFMMSASTIVLVIITIIFCFPEIKKNELNLRNVILGIFSAFLLYAIFWIGNKVMIIVSGQFPGLIPNRLENLSAIYANKGMLPPYLVAFLLFFPIGFGEEIYWRGFIQRFFTAKWNGPLAAIVTASLYTLVHVPAWNPVLILAALTCGLYWGMMYWLTGSLVPVLISHMIWDPAIFILWPIS